MSGYLNARLSCSPKAPMLKERQRSRLGAADDPLDSLAMQAVDSPSRSSSSDQGGPPLRSPSGNQALMKGDSVDGSKPAPSRAKQMLTRMQMQEKESSTML